MAKYEYTITSERAYRKADEVDNKFYSNHEYEVGDFIELDGILWEVTDRKEVD